MTLTDGRVATWKRNGGSDIASRDPIVCRVCRDEGKTACLFLALGKHLNAMHGVSVAEYRRRYPGAPVMSDEVKAHLRVVLEDRVADGRAPVERLWSRGRIIRALREDAARRGRAPRQEEWSRAATNHPSYATVTQRFGTWTNGLRAAGLRPDRTSQIRSRAAKRRVYKREEQT